MSASWLKFLLTLCLFGVTLLFGLTPFAASALSRRGASLFRRRRIAAALTLLNCVAGGVFLGVAFLHLLPEEMKDVDKALELLRLNEKKKLPWALFAVVSGFFIVLALEQFVVFCQERRERKRGAAEVGAGGAGIGGLDISGDGRNSRISIAANDNRVSLLSDGTPYREEKDALLEGNGEEVPLISDERKTKDNQLSKRERSDSPAETERDDEDVKKVKGGGPASSSSSASPTPDSQSTKSSKALLRSFLRSFLLVFALSLHSVLEGLAFGLESEPDKITTLFVALISHKIIMAFTLGISFTSINGGLSPSSAAPPPADRSLIVGSILIFAATSPVGAGIGISLTSVSNGESAAMQLVVGILQSLSCGAFLYVTFFEILPREIQSGPNLDLPRENSSEDKRLILWNRYLRLIKVFAVLIGFVIMAIMMRFIDHGHDHHHEAHHNHTDHHHAH